MKRRPRSAFLLCGLLLDLLWAMAAGASPVIDGQFDDWGDSVAGISRVDEPTGDADFAVDLLPLAFRLDQHGLWLQINASAPANIAQGRRTLSLLIDHQPGGAHYRGSEGVEQVLEYSPPQQLGRYGFRAMTHETGSWQSLEDRPGYLRSAPTISSNRYEILVSMPELSSASRVRVMLFDDHHQDASPWFSLGQRQLSEPAVRPALDRYSPSDGQSDGQADLRVMVWNTGGERTTHQPEGFAALVAAINPDLALLDEVWPTQQAGFLKTLPHQSMGSSGGRQRGLILSRWPLQPAKAFARLDYPPDTAELIRREGSEFMRKDLKNLEHDGVAANGAIVERDGHRILLVALDLQCCGDGDNSVQDRLREIQVQRIAQAIEQVRLSQPFDQLLIGGDFNLVGSARPLELMVNAAVPALSIAQVLQPDGLSNVTWIRDKDVFPPGRLDYLLFSEDLVQRAGVVFNPQMMTDRQLRRYSLQRDATDRMSGHQPLVVDLGFHLR